MVANDFCTVLFIDGSKYLKNPPNYKYKYKYISIAIFSLLME